MMLPALADIRDAARRIKPYIHQTPLLGSRSTGLRAGCHIWLKCENLQKCGAFKARGAHNAVFSLSASAAAMGVATHSSGNHGAALACAASARAIPAYIVMPDNSAQVKIDAVASYGGQITFCAPNLPARESSLAQLVTDTGARFIPPYDDFNVICGQGSVGLEISQQWVEQSVSPDMVVVPVGGGGLLAGVATAIKSLHPDCQVIAAEPSGADDAWQGFRSGIRQTGISPNTVADGLRTAMGVMNFAIMQQRVDEVLCVSDAQIIEATQWIFSRCKLVVETSAAVSLAAVFAHPEIFRGKNVACVLSGGNIDLNKLPWLQ